MGSWEGHLVENHELSYAFDTRGYLPVKVINLPSANQIKYNFELDFVSIPGENGVQSYQYSIDHDPATPELILFNEDKIFRMEILKFKGDSLELKLPNSEPDSKVLYRYYLLLRASSKEK